MATIKSFTDLEQSRKLAEILPLESADMCYSNDGTAIKIDANPYLVRKKMWQDIGVIPCWSLAALLGVLPDNYIDFNDIIKHPSLMKTKDSRYMVIYSASQYTSLCNDPVEACYKMIVNLHKLNLL